MAMSPKDLAAALEGPPPAHVRNINVDTHIGQAPQRPYALLEDHLAAVRPAGYRTVEDLKAALATMPAPSGLPEGAPNPNDVVEDRNGDLVRYVVSGDTQDQFIRDGEIRQRIRFVPRYVSLTLEGARAADSPERPTDYFNGFTWLRGGFKPERDFTTVMQQSTAEDGTPLVFDIAASATDVAVLHHEMRRAEAGRPSLPVESSERQSSKKE